MKICVVTGSRADWGPLEWLVKTLREDAFFDVNLLNINGESFVSALQATNALIGPTSSKSSFDLMILFGDRYEILAAACAAHLNRVPIAHIGGGDVTEGSYDDAMRDCISRMASIHFTTSPSSAARLVNMGYRNVYDVGSTGIDFIIHADWEKGRPIKQPYVVVSYQPETIDDTVNLEAVREAIADRKAVWITPNPDRGSERIPQGVNYSHPEFLNLLYYCDEFIGNSSAMLYEAPALRVKTRMIGKRQRGRSVPRGDGRASENILLYLKYATL